MAQKYGSTVKNLTLCFSPKLSGVCPVHVWKPGKISRQKVNVYSHFLKKYTFTHSPPQTTRCNFLMVFQFSTHPRHVDRCGKLQNHSKIAPGGLCRRVCKIFVNDGDDGIDGDDDDQYGRHQCNRQQKCRSRSNLFRTRNFT